MSTFLEHSRIRKEVEKERLGNSKRSAGQLLKSRIAGHTLTLTRIKEEDEQQGQANQKTLSCLAFVWHKAISLIWLFAIVGTFLDFAIILFYFNIGKRIL